MKQLNFEELKKNILNDNYEERLNFLENYHFKGLTLSEVRYFFEHKRYEIRRDFMEFYHFNDKYYDYYKEYIVNFDKTNNVIYFTDLIELATDLRIVDNRLYEKYQTLLFSKQHYLIKLLILRYFLIMDNDYDNNQLMSLYRQLYNSKLKHGLNGQIILNLLSIDRYQYDNYFSMLTEIMTTNTKYYQMICSIFNQIASTNKFDFIPEKDIKSLIEKVEKIEIGVAVQSAIETCKLYLQNRYIRKSSTNTRSSQRR